MEAPLDILRVGGAAIREYEDFIEEGEALSPLPAPVNQALEEARTRIEEIRARDGRVIALTTPGDDLVASVADTVFEVPVISHAVDSVLLAVPLQLFAYYVAVHRGTDVDQPRNLAKTVTVE